MMTGRCVYAPTEEQLSKLNFTAPRFSSPIIAEALITASKSDVNVELISQLVAETFDRALSVVCPKNSAGNRAQLRSWCKHVQQVVLGVVRTTANPNDRTASGNWARAQFAAAFCMGTYKHAVDDPPHRARACDMLWRLLSQSTCATSTSRDFARRATTWYGMVTRVAVSMTAKNAWQEAHAAMRVHGNLVKEVVTQIKYMEKAGTIGADQIESARMEMCMGSAKEREGESEGIEMDVHLDAQDIMNGLLCEDDFVVATGFDALPDAEEVTMLPAWCVKPVVSTETQLQPDTPPKKRARPPKADAASPRTPKAQGKQKKVAFAPIAKVIMKPASTGLPLNTLPGHFRVIKHAVLAPPVDYTTPESLDLTCTESSSALMAATKNWKCNDACTYTIINGRMTRRDYGFLVPFELGKPLVPATLTLQQALAFRA
jgi:hypothetical protein